MMTDELDHEGTQPKGDKPKGRLAVAGVVELPVKRELSPKHLNHLRTSNLSDETIALAELYTEIRPAALADIVGRKSWPRLCGNGLVFPFYLPGAPEPYGARVRPTTPRTVGQRRDGTPKLVKYDQSTEAGVMVYYPPRARSDGAYRDVTRPLYWTEGEKKALVLDQLGLPCVGLTGVWNYAEPERKDETGEHLHRRIADHVTVAGRAHVICFDADARDNDQVMLAAGRLCGVLLAAGALEVRFVCPPTKEQKGIDDYFAAFGEVVTRQLLASAAPLEPVSPKEPLQRLCQIRALDDAPVGKDLRLPPGYTIERDGSIWKEGSDEKKSSARVARAPIVILRYIDDLYTGASRVEVAWRLKGGWVRCAVDRIAIADRGSVIDELSSLSAPVTSNTASALVDWFEALEHVNEHRFERAISLSRAGWHSIGAVRIFVLGEPVVIDDRGDRKRTFAALRPSKAGKLEQHVAALREAWAASPIAAAAICAAFAAPLLEPLDAPNFALHLPGDSSRGKTSMLKIAASVFGDPNSDQWVASWNTSLVGAELRAAALSGLPLCFDEVGSSDATAIERMVYMLINGGGRARGQKDLSLRETPTWKTIVLSTGERRLADEDAATGAQVRVLQFHVSDFGDLDAAGVDALRELAAEHHGHAGREWVQHLLEIDDWEALRKGYKARVAAYRAAAVGQLAQRQAVYFGLLGATEELLHQALGIGQADGQTMASLITGPAGAAASPSPLAIRARWAVLDWWNSERDAFPELGVSTGTGEPNARAERGTKVLNGYYRDHDRTLLLIPGRLRAYLTERGMSLQEVLRGWGERGWLHAQPSAQREREGVVKAKINGHAQWVVALHVDDDEEPAKTSEAKGGADATAFAS